MHNHKQEAHDVHVAFLVFTSYTNILLLKKEKKMNNLEHK